MNITDTEKQLILDHFPKGIVVFDVETTGLSPLHDTIVELSAVKVDAEGLNFFSHLVNPGKEITKEIIAIHGITNEMVKDAPEVRDIAAKFIKFCGLSSLVAHNAKFDSGFLVFALNRSELAIPARRIYCTLKGMRSCFKGTFESFKLGNLAKGVGHDLENAHRALDDSFACLKIFLYALENKPKRFIDDSFLFNLSEFKKANAHELEEKFKKLTTLCEKKLPIEIIYKGGSFRNQFRPVVPISLLFMPSGQYLYALCLHTNIHKNFSLKKIKEYREPDKALATRYAKQIETNKTLEQEKC